MVLSAALGALGALGSIGGSLFGGLLGANASKSAARDQFAYQSMLQAQAAQLNYDYGIKTAKFNATKIPALTRQGYVNAGFNPMLMVSNGTSGNNASFSGTGTGQAQSNDYAGAISAGVANAQSIQRLKNETEATESMNDKNYAEADEAKARKATLLEKLPFISARERAEISNIDKDSLLKESQIHNMDETTRFIEKRYELDKMLGLMGINAQRYSADKLYAGTVYNADALERNNKRTLRTQRTRINGPFGIGWHAGAYNDLSQYWYDR